ncbi:autotransporter outer membrane beta-barrel domain-containing protein [Orientia tsutsugamushi]|uniref:Outer membrane autotransporter barrel domain protein n=1 Tax=Orientia tsutsugamushi str. TA716 TaxID=1359175 RepID=A0A0F3P9A3_ORITS|nr:autotransporter outer membrane beta-barrel domain-containing protein [Orientia tsutsugamushi]KJV75804.1 outer membrane autotransporter barrel domain protein [Orientia tsutsugamushi str. TA716]
MIKNTKQETFVKISLILSTLFFASMTQRALGMNLLLDKETQQSYQVAKLNYKRLALTSEISCLESQRDQCIYHQGPTNQAIQILNMMRQGLLEVRQRQLLQNVPSVQEMEHFKENLPIPEVQSNNDTDIKNCITLLKEKSEGLVQYENMAQDVCLAVDLICQPQLLNMAMGHHNLYNAAQSLRNVKQNMRSLEHVIDDLQLELTRTIQVIDGAGLTVDEINELIGGINNTIIQQAKLNLQVLIDNVHDVRVIFSEEGIEEVSQYFNLVLQELHGQMEQLNQQIAILNQKITNADQKVKAINLQLDSLDGADTTIPKTSSQTAISFTDQQKALQQAVQNHDTAVTNAIIVNTHNVVSTATSGISDIANKGNGLHNNNIISSGSNICSSNNGWNVQGNIFTSKISKEDNKELKKYDAGINGAFITVNKYVNENTIIGATGLYSNLNIQYDESIKHILNKTDCKTFSLSLNARYYPQHNVFTQGIIGFIMYDGKTEYVANQPSSEINGKGYYGDFMLGCHLNPAKHNLKLTLSPIVGIRYNKVNNSSHKLFDGTNVSDADHHILEGRVGATIKYVIDNKNISIIPEVYAFIHRNLCTNSNDIKLEYAPSSDSGTVDIKPAKIHTLFGQLGGTVTIYRGQIGFGVSYSAYFAEKYIAHVGSLNIKANF